MIDRAPQGIPEFNLFRVLMWFLVLLLGITLVLAVFAPDVWWLWSWQLWR